MPYLLSSCLFCDLCRCRLSGFVVVAQFHSLHLLTRSRKPSSTINRATCACNSALSLLPPLSCVFHRWIQNIFNFSEADKKVKEIAKQNEWHNVQWDEGEWNKFNSFSSQYFFLYSSHILAVIFFSLCAKLRLIRHRRICEMQAEKNMPKFNFFFVSFSSSSCTHRGIGRVGEIKSACFFLTICRTTQETSKSGDMLNEDVHGRAASNRFVNHMTNGDSKKPDIDHVGKWHEQLNDSVRTTCEVSLRVALFRSLCVFFWLTNSITVSCDISWEQFQIRVPTSTHNARSKWRERQWKRRERLLFYNLSNTA